MSQPFIKRRSIHPSWQWLEEKRSIACSHVKCKGHTRCFVRSASLFRSKVVHCENNRIFESTRVWQERYSLHCIRYQKGSQIYYGSRAMHASICILSGIQFLFRNNVSVDRIPSIVKAQFGSWNTSKRLTSGRMSRVSAFRSTLSYRLIHSLVGIGAWDLIRLIVSAWIFLDILASSPLSCR